MITYTHKQTHRQDQLQYTVLLSLAQLSGQCQAAYFNTLNISQLANKEAA